MSNIMLELKFINEPDLNFEYNHVITTFSVIQLIAEILTIFHVLYVLSLLFTSRVCHIHFRILSAIFLIDLILKAVTNMIILTKFITGKTFLSTVTGYFIVNFIQCTACYVYYFYPLSIFVERTIPLIWAKSYENCFSFTFVIAFSLLPIFASVYVTVHLFFLQSWMPILTVYTICNSVMIFGWLIYFAVYFCSRKHLDKEKSQSVSERYQRHENLKTHKTMFCFAGSCIISLVLVTIYINLLRYYHLFLPFISETNMTALLRIIIDTIQAYILLFIPIAFIFTHDKLKAKYFALILSKLITGLSLIQTSAGYFYANVIQCTANYIYYFYPLSIFVERTIPLIWAKSYENFFSVTFVVISLMVPILCGIYITIHLFFLQEWVSILNIYMITNIFLLTTWVGYFLVYYLSKKFTKTNKVQTVSERYQRFENSRTHKTMNWFVVSCVISLLLASGYIHFLRHYKLWFSNISEINMIAMLRIILDTAQAFLFLVIPVAFTFTHEKLKKKYLQNLKCDKNSSPMVSTIMEMQVIKSITGQNMIVRDEQEQYFKSLASDWGVKVDHRDT